MELLQGIATGFETAATLANLINCFVGVFVGTLIGELPGLGPVATISLLLPYSFTMDSSSAINNKAGINYGAQYCCSNTANKISLPREK
jgi:TctA family transporter